MNKLQVYFAVLSLALVGVAQAQELQPPAAVPKPSTAIQRATPAVPAVKGPATAASKAVTKGATPADRLSLETTVVSGNRELPKVLYIVPWKKADLGELPAQPFNTLLDEVLQPVDREVFKREVKYFQAVSDGAGSGGDGNKSGSPPPPVSHP